MNEQEERRCSSCGSTNLVFVGNLRKQLGLPSAVFRCTTGCGILDRYNISVEQARVFGMDMNAYGRSETTGLARRS
jgi:hypothetical protein